MIENDFADAAKLLADPARAKIILALMSGKALTATELSLEANITPQTTSSHLGKLVKSQFLVERKQGRHKYFQIFDQNVAELVEKLLSFSASSYHSKILTGPKNKDLRRARVCYDHLAGEVGVLIFDSLLTKNVIKNQSETVLTEEGKNYFRLLGADLTKVEKAKRPLCKSCLDWSERKSHLAGSIGNWMLEDILQKRFALRDPNSRALIFSDNGLKKLAVRYKFPNLGNLHNVSNSEN